MSKTATVSDSLFHLWATEIKRMPRLKFDGFNLVILDTFRLPTIAQVDDEVFRFDLTEARRDKAWLELDELRTATGLSHSTRRAKLFTEC